MMLTGTQQATIVKDLYKVTYQSFKEVELVFNKIYTVVNGCTGGGEKKTDLLGAGNLVRHTTENQEIVPKDTVQGWQHYCKYHTWSDAVEFSFEAIQDSVKVNNLIDKYASTWGKSIRHCQEEFAARPFRYGGAITTGDYVFNNSWGEEVDPYTNFAYDGYPLWNLATNLRYTKSNKGLYNSVAGLTMTPNDFKTLYVLYTSKMNYDDLNRPVMNKPDTILCKTGSDEMEADVIINTTTGRPNTALNDKNPYDGRVKQVIGWDYLDPDDTENAYFLGKAKHPDVQFRVRQKPDIEMWREPKRRSYNASIVVRHGIWWKDVRAWARAGGLSPASY